MQPDDTKRHEVLQRFLVGFEGATLPGELTAMLAGGLAGVAIYPRNFRSLDELLALTSSIRHAAAGQPVLIGIDQEGGTKFSLGAPFTDWPSPAELGRLSDASLVERVARALARELRAAGVNLDFAPMLDLNTNPDSPVTRGRSFGSDPHEVARLGVAFSHGLAAEGILACAKHFPGHGDAAVDPHLDLPRFDGTRERLAQQELVPFAAAIDAGVPLIMTAHILLPQLDEDRPASVSPILLEQVLRRDLRFDGVILADDLGMGAIAKRFGPGESAVQALQAGTDIVMLCHDWSAVAAAIDIAAQAAADGTFDALQWSNSSARIATLRQRLLDLDSPPPPIDVIGCPEHRALAAEARSTLARSE